MRRQYHRTHCRPGHHLFPRSKKFSKARERHLLFLVPLVTWLMILGACRDPQPIEPVIPGGSRVVLLEEFTGKGCTNCPKGSREIDNLLAIYDTNLVVVSIHAGFFANPQFFSLGDYDLRTAAGEEIFALLAPNIGYPAAVINRTQYDGTFQQGTNAWAARIAEQIEEEPMADFTLTVAYDFMSRSAEVRIDAIARANIRHDVRITVQVTENGIVDAQDDSEAGGIVDDYVHNHVLRWTATAFDGELIRNGMQPGDAFQQVYILDIDQTWDARACDIVAFLSGVGAGENDIRILQARSVRLVP